jgi:hypothetical protein
MSGTVPPRGSSMRPGKQVVVVSKTATDYRTPKPTVVNASPHSSTPLSSGAPMSAPTATEAITAEGPAAEGAASHPAQGARKPKPSSSGSTQPIEQGASVDYDRMQGSRVDAAKGAPGLTTGDYSAQQQQEKKRR